MDKWEIRSEPSSDDPDRHRLLLKGDQSDVAAILKKFGALMGRPSPVKTSGFNLSLIVHKLKPEKQEKLTAWLNQRAPIEKPVEKPKTVSKLKSVDTPKPAPPKIVEDTAPLARVLEPTPAPITAVTPAPIPPMPAPIPPAPKPPEPKRPRVETAAVVPADAAPPTPVARPAPATAVGAILGVDLRPDWTMDTLLVGAYNRFCHAAAMSILSSPGTMYNPLFIYGVPGTGKSHMLHAIGSALSKGLGGAVLLSTSASKLSRTVNEAIAANDLSGIERKVAQSKALMIDDVHLMAVSDQNKEALAKIFKSFFDRGLQVVISSLYPPRSLGALEEGLGFSFSKGWSVDLKVPSPNVQKDLIAGACERSGLILAPDELTLLHEKLSVVGYQELTQWIKRIIIFQKLRLNADQPASLQTVLPVIYDPLQTGGTEAPRPDPNFKLPPTDAHSEPMAVITPQGQEGLGAFVASIFYPTGAQFGLKKAYRHALWESYDPAQPFGVPFSIGEMCLRAGVTKALVVGPMPDSPLGPRAAELAHATRRILESFGIEMGWIPYNGLSSLTYFLNAHLDLVRLPQA